jgi:plastocyanin
VVQESGFSYNPAIVTINVGDSVRFDGTASHPVLQVSATTWNNNGATALAGGFSFPSGKGIVGFPDAGTYYYVCTAHVASQGMKGKIVVNTVTSVNEHPSEDYFEVFPVPLYGNQLSVYLSDDKKNLVSVDIFDLTGALRLKSLVSSSDGRYLIDCSALAKGAYIIRLQSGELSHVTKLIRE